MTGLNTYFGVRNTPQGARHILNGALGGVVLRPWFDWVAVRSIAGAYFPASRAWAAAQEAAGSTERFNELAATKPIPASVAGRMIRLVARRQLHYEAAASRWQDAFFGSTSPSGKGLAEVERARRVAAHAHMAARAVFAPAVSRLRPVRWEISPPAVAEARHGHRLRDPKRAFAAPKSPALDVSRVLRSGTGTDCWLRYPSPVMTDLAWARVSSPADGDNPPTLIFLHGIGVEFDMWRDASDALSSGAIEGFRLIRPEAPWHGRRRRPGWYGGEPAIGEGPLGFLDLFQAWIAEIAVLIDWARRTSRGPVVLGGVSLGALVAQLAAVAAHDWPRTMRPDALFLVATSGAMMDVVRAGSLSRSVGLQRRLEQAGWSDALLERWLPLLEPWRAPVLPPGKVVMVIGGNDDLTPFSGGLDLAREWRIPPDNLFVRRQGHFSVSLGLIRDPAPLGRLSDIAKAG